MLRCQADVEDVADDNDMHFDFDDGEVKPLSNEEEGDLPKMDQFRTAAEQDMFVPPIAFHNLWIGLPACAMYLLWLFYVQSVAAEDVPTDVPSSSER